MQPLLAAKVEHEREVEKLLALMDHAHPSDFTKIMDRGARDPTRSRHTGSDTVTDPDNQT